MNRVVIGDVVRTPSAQTFMLATPRRDYGQVQLALAGDHQIANAIVAVRLLEEADARGLSIGPDAIRDALTRVRWPGRLEHVGLPNGADALLDAAHNPAGADALASYLATIGTPRPLVFSAMRDKDATLMLQALLPAISRVVVTRASNPRAAEPAGLAALIRTLHPSRPVEIVEDPAAAVAHASHGGQHIVVAGSIFLLADVMKGMHRS
ncbi:MAG: cyanophycin synthetase [Vicinamibacterales bacterium]